MLEVKVGYDTAGLDAFNDELESALAGALAQNAEDIMFMAKALCPADTGNLRASLHVEKLGRFTYAVRDGVYYGIFVEKGHLDKRTGMFVGPFPFLGPAVERMGSRAKGRLRTTIEETVGHYVRTPSEREADEKAIFAKYGWPTE